MQVISYIKWSALEFLQIPLKVLRGILPWKEHMLPNFIIIESFAVNSALFFWFFGTFEYSLAPFGVNILL